MAADRVVIRPRGLIIVAAVTTVALVAGSLLFWFGMAPETRALFTLPQILTLLLFLAVLLVALWFLAGSSVVGDQHGITIRNGWRQHQFTWDEVVALRMSRHDSFGVCVVDPALLGRHHTGALTMLGVLSTEGERSQRGMAGLTRLWHQSGAAPTGPAAPEDLPTKRHHDE